MKIFCFISITILLPISDAVSSSVLTISIDENTPIGKTVINLKNELKSNDSKVFAPFRGISPYFRFTPQGDVMVHQPLDRDNDSNLCSDNGFPDVCSVTQVIWLGSSIISLRIVINDLNDNKPYWPIQPKISIAENSPINMEVDLPLAIDKDTSTNGIDKYLMLTTDVSEFELKNRQSPNGIIPKLIVKKLLDREKVQQYNLTIAAVDGSSPYHTGVANLIIEIADQNDNKPVFEKTVYRVTINENYPLQTFLPVHPKATDFDNGKFGEITYHFSIATTEEVKSTFNIHKKSGQISVEKNIDYDLGKHSFEFIIVAVDGGSPALSATASIFVEVKDLNDQIPAIAINYVSPGDDGILQVPENDPPNNLVTTITVSDTDIGDGGKFNCSLSLTNSFILKYYKSLDHISVFQLISVRTFDREMESIIHTQIICQDKGIPSQTSKKLITVNISDLNDNRPKFSKNRYKFMMNEENPLNAEMGKVVATDLDSGDNGKIEYFIVASEMPKKMFTIDSRGIIIAREKLDREVNPGFKFRVIAKDCGTPSLNDSVEVEIELVDVNDCPPVFSSNDYKFPVVENDKQSQTIPVPVTIGKVDASDCDIGINAKKTFKLLEPHPLFQVTDTGYVEVIGILDREKESFYSLDVIVMDSLPTEKIRNTATSKISITISDRNDNPPVFVTSVNMSHSIRVSHYEDIGTEIFKVQANDADSGMNAVISYKIKNNHFVDFFTINPKSGSIVIAKRLTRNQEGEHIITVVAEDQGTPSLSSEMGIKVVIDNSVPPSYRPTSSSIFISNNKLVIIIVVVSTILVCGILISVICLMTNCRHPHGRHGLRMQYDGDVGKTMGSLTHSCLSQYDANNVKFTDINESLLPPSSFYLVNNQPNSYTCPPQQSNAYTFDSFSTIPSPYKNRYGNNVDSNDLALANNDAHSGIHTIGDRHKIQSTNYRQSPHPFSSMTLNMDNGGHPQASTFRTGTDNSDSLNRTMNWTIRSGYYDQPNYEIMYANNSSNARNSCYPLMGSIVSEGNTNTVPNSAL